MRPLIPNLEIPKVPRDYLSASHKPVLAGRQATELRIPAGVPTFMPYRCSPKQSEGSGLCFYSSSFDSGLVNFWNQGQLKCREFPESGYS